MQKREIELKNNLPNKFSEWIVFKIHDLSSKHSQDWMLSLYWIIMISFIYFHFKTFESQKDIELYIIPLFLNLIILIYILFENIISKNLNSYYKIISIIAMYLIYGFISNDFKLIYFSNNLNPFSIMIGWDTLTLTTLIYKIIISYLLYQFVISIRQNTRRK